MRSTFWIDGFAREGDLGFIVQYTPQDRAARYELVNAPAVTNMSREPRLRGWCGSYNNTSTDACGVGVVIKVAKNGRARVRQLQGDEERRALLRLGWGDLQQ